MSVIQRAANKGLIDSDIQDSLQWHAGARSGQDPVDAEYPLIRDHESIAVLLQDSPSRLQAKQHAEHEEHPVGGPLQGKGTDEDHDSSAESYCRPGTGGPVLVHLHDFLLTRCTQDVSVDVRIE